MRIVIADDEALLSDGLRLLLERAGDDVVATVGDADGLLLKVEELVPDLVVTDIRMPPSHTDDGLRAALEIRRRYPAIGVMVLSQHVQGRYAIELIRGAAGPFDAGRRAGFGYLLKQRVAHVEQFRRDLVEVSRGGTVLDPEVAAVIMGRASQRHGSVEQLTTRQREVLGLLASGRSNVAIADRLGVTERGVKQHIAHIYETLGIPAERDDHRRVLAVLRYLSG